MTQSFCIIGINFAPEQTGCAPYTTDLANALIERGKRVQVITGFPHYPEWRIPKPYKRRFKVSEQNGALQIRRLRHFVPASANALTRGLYELTFLLHVLIRTRRLKNTVIVAVSPSLSGAVAGVLLRGSGSTVSVLVQDLMTPASTQSAIRGGSLVTQLVRRLESAAFRAADQIGIISSSFQDTLLSMGVAEDKITLTPNYALGHIEPMDHASSKQELGWSEREFVVLHTGNMGLKQSLKSVVEAARILDSQKMPVRFIFVGDGNQKDALVASANGLDNVAFLSLVPAEAYSKLLAAADLLLLHESFEQTEMSLPSKLTAYFASGRPVLVCTNPSGPTAAEASKVSAVTLIASDNPALLANTLVQKMEEEDPPVGVHSAGKFGVAPRELRQRRAEWALDPLKNGKVIG